MKIEALSFMMDLQNAISDLIKEHEKLHARIAELEQTGTLKPKNEWRIFVDDKIYQTGIEQNARECAKRGHRVERLYTGSEWRLFSK